MDTSVAWELQAGNVQPDDHELDEPQLITVLRLPLYPNTECLTLSLLSVLSFIFKYESIKQRVYFYLSKFKFRLLICI